MCRPPSGWTVGGWLWVLTLSAVPTRGAESVLPWSFRPVTTPAPPPVQNEAWPRQDLDRFILAGLEARALTPNPPANRYQLIRRAAFDLTGLPPSEAEILAFARDPRSTEEAFAEVVDRYLASSRFGERWARHWLDVVHYADSIGNIWNAPFIYAWQYRDYVIEAFNRNTPFDRFILEQIAGDLLPASNALERRRNLLATGMLAFASLDLTEGSFEQLALDRADDQIDVVTRGILGLTVSCARCHDHKYDPVSQADYYALAGIFLSTQTWTGQRPRGGTGNHGYVDIDAVLSLGNGGPVAGASPGSPVGRVSMAAGVMGTRVASDGQQTYEWTLHPDRAMGLAEGEVVDAAIRIDGEAYQRGAVQRRGNLRIPGLPALPPVPRGGSGRLQLAQWLVSRQNPLTARVWVNRVWLHLIGQPLVATVDDFGVNSAPPVQAALLDHLASGFMANGWSNRWLIRSILLSRVYALDSSGNPTHSSVDAENHLLWRGHARRLEWEPLRDSLARVGGWLDLNPPPGLAVAGNGGKGRYGRTRPLLDTTASCRTIYLPVLRSLLPETYGVFDFPDPSQIQGRREVTTVPTQALFFLNNPLVEQAAAGAASQLLTARGLNDVGRIRLAYLKILGRPPDDGEIGLALAFLRGISSPAGVRDLNTYRWSAWVQTLLAAGEFRYVL